MLSLNQIAGWVSSCLSGMRVGRPGSEVVAEELAVLLELGDQVAPQPLEHLLVQLVGVGRGGRGGRAEGVAHRAGRAVGGLGGRLVPLSLETVYGVRALVGQARGRARRGAAVR